MRVTGLIIIILLVLVGAALGATIYYTYEDLPIIATRAPVVTSTQAPPTPGNVVAEGTIVPRRQATLAFKIAGGVTALNVREGDQVMAGTVLVKLNDTDLRNQVKQGSAALQVARAELARLVGGATAPERQAAQDALAAAQAKYDVAQKAKANDSTLKEAAAAVSQAKSAVGRLDPSPQAVAVAQAQVDQAQAALDSAMMALDQASLEAPFTGTVAQVKVNIGDFVGPGIPVVILGDLSGLTVESSDISDLDIGRVKVGQKVKVTLTALPEQTFHGGVARISPMASESRGYKVFRVWIDLKEGIESGLRWGMDAKIEVLSP